MGDTIVGVQFGISNPDDILKRSVVEVLTDKTYQSGAPVPNGVFDSRFGVIENGKVCPTCKQTNQHCPGHFGHIRLARPVYLYQFFDVIEKLCNCICLQCSSIIADRAELAALKSKGAARFKDVRDRKAKPKKDAVCATCKVPLFKKVSSVLGKALSLEGHLLEDEDKSVNTVPIQTELVLRAFQRITDEDAILLGFHPKYSRPEWMVCTVLAVPPLTVRPSVVMDDQQRMEDDLTHKLIDIVRSNARVRERLDKKEIPEIVDKYTAHLQYDVATYIDNDIKGMAPSQQRSGRPLRTLKSRFGAKTGRVRGNLMGKRVDFSARSVITPDAHIDLDELGVPIEIASNLTFPETVSSYNRDRLMSYVRNGPDKHPGAKSVYVKRDNATFRLNYVNPETIELRDGDIVHRHLVDGDIVLFNRQPSLHKASMEAHRVRVLPYSTFRLNVSATRPYNADFDGDEMNMHVPQSIAAATELRVLASVLRNIISPRTNSPIIQLFQDTMTGVYRLTAPNVQVPEHIAMNIVAGIDRPFVRKGRAWTGAELMSAALPLMSYKTKKFEIEDGMLLRGQLDKSTFGKTSVGLVHVVYNDFSPERCGQLINDIQSVITQYNLYTGFSVGASDLIADEETLASVRKAIEDSQASVRQTLTSMHAGGLINATGKKDGDFLEETILGSLRQVASKINESVKKTISPSNRIIQMVASGSKGSDQNITQMMGALSQQLIEGKRVQYTLQDRTLPHFPRYDDTPESRGFVVHSFVDGLTPVEFFFHAQAGREGLIDTAVKTSDTGYIQRRLMKTMEDQHVEYDGTVRNVTGTIVQFRYGDDGVDTTYVEEQECDLLTMPAEAVYRAYALTAEDVNPFLTEAIDRVEDDLVDALLADRRLMFENVSRRRRMDNINAPVHIERLLQKYKNKYSTKTDLTPAEVVKQLREFEESTQNKLFAALLRYHLAPRKAIIDYRLSVKTFTELMGEVAFKYAKARVHPGEMVGALAAQSIGEPTTQLTLNTFHSAGTAKANATSGVPRIEELLSASTNPKRPSNTIYLLPEIGGSEIQTIRKMKEIQRTTLRDIAMAVRIRYSAAGDEVDEVKKLFVSADDKTGVISGWSMEVDIDPKSMVERGITDLRDLDTKLLRWAVSTEVVSMDGSKVILRLRFPSEVAKNPLQLRFLEDKILDCVLKGVDGIGRVYLREVKDELLYNREIDAYEAPSTMYVLDVEGTNLYDLLVFEGVDATRTSSNDIHEVLKVFGVEAARMCLYEEINEVFSTEKVNYHHLSVLVDTMTFSGRIVAVNRFGMNKNETGVLAKSSFEETSKIMFNAAVWAEADNMRGVSANIMFGQKPPCGTGFVDILVDENLLPEGQEVFESPREDMARLNEQLGALNIESDCRLEDIRMDW